MIRTLVKIYFDRSRVLNADNMTLSPEGMQDCYLVNYTVHCDVCT